MDFKIKKSFLLISHGSRSSRAQKEVRELAQLLKKKTRAQIFEYAFLDVGKPDIPMGMRKCITKGATDIVVLLNFLNSGEHALKDIPGLIKETLKDFPRVSVSITQPIGQHADISKLFLDVIQKHSSR